MQSYLNLLRLILKHGKPKKTRGHMTIGMFALDFNFDLSTGKFPLLTTRRLGMRSIAAELFCFLHGVTSKKTFRSAGTSIWDEWCNPTKVQHIKSPEARKEAMLEEDDLGPIYGFQWRAFGQHYAASAMNTTGNTIPSMIENQQTDQLQNILHDLKCNRDSRRMVCSAWCPTQAHMQALPPCHVAWNLVHYDGKLNLFWHQRSCDMVLGVPYNIASYALLLLLLCKHADLQPGCISGKLVDAHIYVRDADDRVTTSCPDDVVCHREGLREQLERQPTELPSLGIMSRPGQPFNILQWKPTDYALTDYEPHPAIKFKVAV